MLTETLVILALSGCAPTGPAVVCRFPAPPDLARRHVRLQVSCPDAVYVNGSRVDGAGRVRRVAELLLGQAENTLKMPSRCEPAKLLVTPRVYIAAIRPEGDGLAVIIENTLDNTVSVGLSCRGPAASKTASATIPARGQSDLSIPLAAKGRVSCVLEKTPEALEEAYSFQTESIFQ